MPNPVTEENLPARFYRRVVAGPGGCHIWVGSLTPEGYGLTTVPAAWRTGKSPLQGSHRVAWRMYYGVPVPDGLVMDHLCRVPRCVNPLHLDAVTHQENVARGKHGILHVRPTHCPHGHEYTKENTYIGKKNEPKCRQCQRDRWHENKRIK